MQHLETDPDSGAQVHQLTGHSGTAFLPARQNTPTSAQRSTDNIYGEQPYSSRRGSRIVVRHYSVDGVASGLSILDLEDGALHQIEMNECRFPAFHAWGDWLYYQDLPAGAFLLKRLNYETLEVEDVATLPSDQGRLSYGTVSGDGRYYAVAAHRPDRPCQVLLIDLQTCELRTLAESNEYLFKHEQFSLDGENRVLIQANPMPDVKEVHLGVMEVDGEGIEWLAADRPHTPRPTGHESWIGGSARVFFSTAYDEERQACIWTVGLGDETSVLACSGSIQFGHVSVSRCGRYWIADAPGEEDIPIYAGLLGSANYRRLVFSRTQHDGKQWSHTHPYLTADNKWLIFTSNRSGLPQVCGANVPDEFWESL